MRFQLYLDNAGEWRWRLKARNGRILADSGEGYVRFSGLVRSLRLVFPSGPQRILAEQAIRRTEVA